MLDSEMVSSLKTNINIKCTKRKSEVSDNKVSNNRKKPYLVPCETSIMEYFLT